MDPDEIREKWAEQDRKLEASLRLNHRLLNVAYLGKAQSALRRLALGLALEGLLDLIVIVALGSFIYQHIGAARFAIPAIALDLYAIVIFNTVIRRIVLALQIDYSGPIAAIQRQVEALRLLSLRSTQWTLLTAPLAWTPFLIVALKGFFGGDAYRLPIAGWLLGNLLFGLLFIPVALWISRRFSERMSGNPFVQRLMRDLAGYNLNAACGFIETLSDFETE